LSVIFSAKGTKKLLPTKTIAKNRYKFPFWEKYFQKAIDKRAKGCYNAVKVKFERE